MSSRCGWVDEICVPVNSQLSCCVPCTAQLRRHLRERTPPDACSGLELQYIRYAVRTGKCKRYNTCRGVSLNMGQSRQTSTIFDWSCRCTSFGTARNGMTHTHTPKYPYMHTVGSGTRGELHAKAISICLCVCSTSLCLTRSVPTVSLTIIVKSI